MSERPAVAFYCLADERYFVGAAGLVNSLRLVGHTEPIFLLDCGLAPAQRALLEPHVDLIPGPSDIPPYLLKTWAPLARSAEVMVVIDCDMIVTRPLTDPIAAASPGRVVGVDNAMNRSLPEWGQLLDLGPVHRQPSVTSALVVLGGSSGEEVLRLWDDRQRHVDFELGWFRKRDLDYPFLLLEEDVLNAVLSTRLEPDDLMILENRLAPVPPFGGLEVLDVAALRCAYADGTEPYAVHQYRCKPWLEPAYDGVYSRLLRRLLAGPGVAVRVPREDIPLRLRTGPLSYLERQRVNAREQVRWRVGGLARRFSGVGEDARHETWAGS